MEIFCVQFLVQISDKPKLTFCDLSCAFSRYSYSECFFSRAFFSSIKIPDHNCYFLKRQLVKQCPLGFCIRILNVRIFQEVLLSKKFRDDQSHTSHCLISSTKSLHQGSDSLKFQTCAIFLINTSIQTKLLGIYELDLFYQNLN